MPVRGQVSGTSPPTVLRKSGIGALVFSASLAELCEVIGGEFCGSDFLFAVDGWIEGVSVMAVGANIVESRCELVLYACKEEK